MQDQEKQLDDVLMHASRSVPYWHDLLKKLPHRAGGRDLLASLPLLSRSDVRENYQSLIANDIQKSECGIQSTTGTTGEPLRMVIDCRYQAANTAAIINQIDRILGKGGVDGRDLYHLSMHVGATSRTMPAPWASSAQVVKWNLSRLWLADDDRFLDGLSRLNNQIVTTMPSIAELLADRLSRCSPDRKVQPAIMILSGQQLTQDSRERIMHAFACPVTSLYTSSEAGVIAAECATDSSYHVEPMVYVEIVDEQGVAVQPGQIGEVVVTPLANLAMPLFRYRTSDRAVWVDTECCCGQSSRRLTLVDGRRPSHIVSATEQAVEVIQFSKLFASLNVDRIQFRQDRPGIVEVEYQAGQLLPSSAKSLIAQAVKVSLGPGTIVGINRTIDNSVARDLRKVPNLPVRAYPDSPNLTDLVPWLRSNLKDIRGLRCATITGSGLDPQWTTSFSDVDLCLLFDTHFVDSEWISVGRYLRQECPRLVVYPTSIIGLATRSPLFACRLLAEQQLVVGSEIAEVLPWPDREDLRMEARFWIEAAQVTIASHLIDPTWELHDHLRAARICSKWTLQAIRFLLIIQGERETGVRQLLELAMKHGISRANWYSRSMMALAVSCEHVPPPNTPVGESRYLETTLEALRYVACEVF